MSRRKTSSWSFKKLEELGFIGRGKSKHRPRNDPSLYGGKYPFIQTGDIKAANLYVTQYSQTYNEKGLSQSKLWPTGTLCLTIAANIAETAILGINSCFPDSVVGFVPEPEKADVYFVKYYIDTIKMQMQNVSRGTTQDNLSLEKISTFNLHIPPLSVQREIASVLSAYDDLIENNTRRIRILEEIAQSLYREWFIHFRFPGHEKVKLINSPLGKIPKGWEVKKLGDEVELAYGKALKAQDRVKGTVHVYGSGGIIGYHNKSLAEGPGIIVGRKGNVGSVYWSDEEFYPIDTVFFIKTELCMPYIYYNLKHQNFINNDAAVPGLNRNQAYSLPLLVPEVNMLKTFTTFVSTNFDQLRILKRKNANLRHTRDFLLPKLIYGGT